MKGEANRLFFNTLAGEWDNRVTHNSEKIRMIIEKAGINANKSVLDIGCGTGIMLPFLRETIGGGSRLVALDIAENMVSRAREKYGPVADEYIVADFFDYHTSAPFDVIVAYSCFPHFGEHAAFFRKTLPLLKTGGRLVVAHSESKNAINRIHTGNTNVINISTPLPAVTILSSEAEQENFKIICAEDTGEHYLLVLQK